MKYGYDGVALSGCTTAPPALSPVDANPISYRTAMCDGSGASAWAHDPLGRVLTEGRIILGSSALSKTVKYAYYKDGELNTLTYPSSRKITYTANSSGGYSAGRLTSAVDVNNSISYVTNAAYAPHGALSGFTNGASIVGAFTFNSRLQPLQMFYGTNTPPSLTGSSCPSQASAGNIMHRLYNFHLGSGDNGNVSVVNNCRDTTRTQLRLR